MKIDEQIAATHELLGRMTREMRQIQAGTLSAWKPPATRAITPEEKRQVIDDLLDIWLAHPELRLGQLIHVLYRGATLAVIEDKDLVGDLRNWYAAYDARNPRP